MSQKFLPFEDIIHDTWQCLSCGNWTSSPTCRICNPPLVQPPRVGMHDYSSKDLSRLNTSKAKVFALARSGVWFTNKQLIELTGSVDAPKRRRELEHVDHFKFEKRKVNGTNVFEFRLIQE